LVVLITDVGHVDQRTVEVPHETVPLDEEALADLRARINTHLVGKLLAETPPLLVDLAGTVAPARRPVVQRVADVIADQVEDRRQDRLVMAGAANLARTEKDFPGSILPVL